MTIAIPVNLSRSCILHEENIFKDSLKVQFPLQHCSLHQWRLHQRITCSRRLYSAKSFFTGCVLLPKNPRKENDSETTIFVLWTNIDGNDWKSSPIKSPDAHRRGFHGRTTSYAAGLVAPSYVSVSISTTLYSCSAPHHLDQKFYLLQKICWKIYHIYRTAYG